MPARAAASDWLVIGGGIVGLVSAYTLQRAGAAVTVIDDDNPSASRAGAGILSPLPPWRYDRTIQSLAAAGAAAYPALLAELGDPCGYRTPGLLALPPHSPPHPQTPLLLPQVAVLHPRRLIRALRRRLHRRIARVTGIAIQNDTATATLHTAEQPRTKNILLAAGAWSGLLCPPPSPAIHPVRGQMLLYRAPHIDLPHILFQESQDIYLLSRPDGTILAGSTSEQAGYAAHPTLAGRQKIHTAAASLLPALKTTAPRAAWAGLRPASSHPTITRHPRAKNLYLNTGHHRYGVTMAPAAATRLLEIIDNRV